MPVRDGVLPLFGVRAVEVERSPGVLELRGFETGFRYGIKHATTGDGTHRTLGASVLNAPPHEAPRERGQADELRRLQCVAEGLIQPDVARVNGRMRDAEHCGMGGLDVRDDLVYQSKGHTGEVEPEAVADHNLAPYEIGNLLLNASKWTGICVGRNQTNAMTRTDAKRLTWGL